MSFFTALTSFIPAMVGASSTMLGKVFGKKDSSGSIQSNPTADLIGSGISGLMGSLSARNSVAYQNELAQNNAKYWANYNSPANQMLRLKEAGLNPNLVYGNGADAQMNGAVTSPSAPTYMTPNDVAALRQMQVQNENVAANTRKTNAEAVAQEYQNTINRFTSPAELGFLKMLSERYKVDTLSLTRDITATESNIKTAELKLAEFNLNELQPLIKEKHILENVVAQVSANYAEKLTQAQLAQYSAAVTQLIASAHLSQSQTEYNNLVNNMVKTYGIFPGDDVFKSILHLILKGDTALFGEGGSPALVKKIVEAIKSALHIEINL